MWGCGDGGIGFFLAHIWTFLTHMKKMGTALLTHIKKWVKKCGLNFGN